MFSKGVSGADSQLLGAQEQGQPPAIPPEVAKTVTVFKPPTPPQASKPLSQDFTYLPTPQKEEGSQAEPSATKLMNFQEVMAGLAEKKKGMQGVNFSNLRKYVEERNIPIEKFPLITKDEKGQPLDKEQAKQLLKFLKEDSFFVRETEGSKIAVEFMIDGECMPTQYFELFIDQQGEWKISNEKGDRHYILEEWTVEFSKSLEVRPLDPEKDIDWDFFRSEKSK